MTFPSQFLYLSNEKLPKVFDGGELIGRLNTPCVPMMAFAFSIIVTQYPFAPWVNVDE
jgi:hypothetical protein